MDKTNQPINKEELNNKKQKQSSPKAMHGKGEDKGALKKSAHKKDNHSKGSKGASAAGQKTLAKGKKFLKGSWAELKKVHWPNRRELIAFTSVVLVAVIIVAALIFIVDSALSAILDVIIPN